MKKSVTVLFFIMVICGLQSEYLLSQVTLKLNNINAPGQVNASQLCNVTITRTGSDSTPYNYYLEGSITNSKDGKIVTGQSNNFQLKIGTTVFTPSSLSGCTYSILNDKYKGIETSKPPPGKYTICVALKMRQPAKSVAEDCITITIEDIEIPPASLIQLVLPSDGQKVNANVPVTFTWTPLIGQGVSYNLKIVEYKDTKPDMNSFINDRGFFSKEDLKMTTFTYPVSERKFEEGTKYLWSVQGNINGKPIGENKGWVFPWSFEISKGEVPPIDSIITIKRDTIKKDEGLINIDLLSPFSVDSSNQLSCFFEWILERSPLQDIFYTLKVVELKESQTPDDALKNNTAFWEQSNIKETYIKCPFEFLNLDKNKCYVWDIKGFDSNQKLIALSNYDLICTSIDSTGPPPPPPPPTLPWICCILGGYTTYKICQGDPLIINCNMWCSSPSFQYTLTSANGLITRTGSSTNGFWSTYANINISDIVNVPCGIYTFTLTVTRSGCTNIWNNPKTIKVYVYPNACNFLIKDDNVSITEICWGKDAVLEMQNICSLFNTNIQWDFSDDGGNTWYGWCSGPNPTLNTYCTGNGILTNSIKPNCPSGATFVNRLYRAKFIGNPPSGWPTWSTSCTTCTKTLKVWCPTQPGTIAPTSLSGHTIQGSPNYFKICSDLNNDGTTDYPINLKLTLNNSIGTISGWNPPPASGSGTEVYYNITSANTYTYSVNVQNGTCPLIPATITIKVEDPFLPLITGNKTEVCPNQDAKITLTNYGSLPAGSTLVWEYCINDPNCNNSSPWISANTGSGPTQNTNQLGDLNPWYPNILDQTLTEWKICWRAKVVTGSGSICPGPFISNVWTIYIMQPPKPPVVTVSPDQPMCCPGTATLTATPTSGGTGAFTYQWFYNYSLLPGETNLTLTTTQEGYYYIVAYNKYGCDSAKSNIVQVKCCKFNVSISGPCCIPIPTVLQLYASVYIEPACGSVASYLWTGPNIVPGTETSQTITIDPQPTATSTYTVTVSSNSSPPCVRTASFTVINCP